MAAGEVRDQVVAPVEGAPEAMAAAGTAARVEVAAVEEAAAASVVPAVYATVAVADLMAAVGDASGGVTSGRSAPLRRVTSSPSMLAARVLAREHMLIGRGGAGDRAADVRRESRR